MTYGTMQARIADELGRPDLTPHIKKAIQSALRFYESERMWFNEAEATATTVSGEENIAVPTDLIEIDVLTLTQSSVRERLARKSYAWIRQHSEVATATAIPEHYAYYADQLWLYPVPNGAYTLTMSYVQRLGTLNDPGDTNAWMTHGEELIRNRAKYDLLSGRGKDYRGAAALEVLVDQAYWNLRGKATEKTSTKVLAVDGGLVARRGTEYNINTDT